MRRSLALGFWMLLTVTEVVGFTCLKCDHEYKNETCQTTATYCNAGSGKSCFRQKLFLERVLLYSRSGCALNCKNVDGGTYIRHINQCCEFSHCNKRASLYGHISKP